MALSPIAFIAPNYRDFKNYWLKAYEPGTTTPKSMALDDQGTVTVAKLELNKDGFIESAGGALVIPYIDGAYDAWIFPTEAEADANDTVNAERVADNIIGVNGDIIANSVVFKVDILQDAIDEDVPSIMFDGAALNIAGRNTKNDDAGAMWDVVLAASVTPNTFNIVQCIGISSLALVLRVGDEANVRQFGAVGDGAADDTNAIQAVFDYVAPNGGVVFFPTPAIYKVTSELSVTSSYPVVIKSDMRADNNALPKSYIKIGANIGGSIMNVSSRGAKVSGLWFVDETGQIGVSQGTFTVNAALKLSLFGMGLVEDCYFDQILGAGIEVDNMIRGNLTRVHMRDCGTPAIPAFWLNSQTSLAAGQITITDCHLETCFGTYLHLSSNTLNAKILGCHFESDDLNTDTHKNYIFNGGGLTIVDSCSFNQQSGFHIFSDAARLQISNCSFAALSGGVSGPRLSLNASFNVVSNCIFNGTSADTGTVIDDVSGNSSFSNNIINAGGNVKLGVDSTWSGGKIVNANTTEAYCIVMSSGSAVTGTKISESLTAGGISSTTRCAVSGNVVRNNTGTGIANGSSTSTIVGNNSSGNGADYAFTAYPSAYNANNNYAGDSSLPLKASVTWNPVSLANGESESINVSVTGSVIGDMSVAGFPMRVGGGAGTQDGVQVSSAVSSNNTVKVTITNNSGGSVDLDSNTLTVSVLKV